MLKRLKRTMAITASAQRVEVMERIGYNSLSSHSNIVESEEALLYLLEVY